MNRQRVALSLSICVVVAGLLASALFTSTAQRTGKGLEQLPPELDVRVRGGVLSGRLPSGQVQSQSAVAALSLRPNAAQNKSVQSLEASARSPISVEYNPTTGTPRHLLATAGYLSAPSQEMPEKIARDFIDRWQGIYRFSDSDLQSLRLKSRTTLPDLGSTILLFEQQVGDVPVYKGEVLVNVNRDGNIINVGGDSYPQLTVTNGVSLSPAEAITAAAASLGIEGFVPRQTGTRKSPRSFGNLSPEFIDAPRFDKGGVFGDDIIVTHVLFPMGSEARHAYHFVLTTPQYRGIMLLTRVLGMTTVPAVLTGMAPS
jgi:fungalysin/thermolysin propeptide